MQGVVFLGEKELELRDFPDPEPGPGEVVLEIKASGMCGSDLNFYRAARGGGTGSLGLGGDGEPVIAGHEPCGVVAAVGAGVSADRAGIGLRVMNHHYKGCGSCDHCAEGWPQLCRRELTVYGVTGHGGHARYLKVPAETLVPLPEALSFEVGAAIACGTGTAHAALLRLDLSGGGVLAVFGQGPVGLSATMIATAMGARVLALDTVPQRRALAGQFGADAVIDPGAGDPVEAILELTGGVGADFALDCSGNAEARLAAVRCTRTWGRTCFVGEGGSVTLDVSPHLLRRQRTLIASWTFSRAGLADCARFVAEKNIPVERLFTHRWKLEQAEEAYKLFDTQTTGKGVFLP